MGEAKITKINWRLHNYINKYIYIYNIINNSRRKDKGNLWHDGGCISDTKFC